jgi:hypothetical protein
MVTGLFGIITIKAIPAFASAAVLIYFNNKISDGWRWGIAIALFWILLIFVSWRVGMYVCGLALKLSEYAKNFKKSYAALYGENYKEPTFEDFGLKAEDYYAYNRRFQLDILKMILQFGTLFGVAYLRAKQIPERGFIPLLIIGVPGVAAAFVVHILFTIVNEHLSRKWPQHEKVEAYERAKTIYRKIEEEIRERGFRKATM